MTSFGPGHAPSTSVSGLNGESGFPIEKPRFGAPPKTTALPSSPMNWVVSESTLPSACATAGSASTFGSSDSLKVGSVTPLPSLRSKADLPVMTALEPCRMSVKILSNACEIESVRT